MTDRYEIGTDDFYVVLYWIVLLTGLRAGAMSYLFIPFARWAGVKKRKGQVRFAEQAWLFCYDTPFFSLGAVRTVPSYRSLFGDALVESSG